MKTKHKIERLLSTLSELQPSERPTKSLIAKKSGLSYAAVDRFLNADSVTDEYVRVKKEHDDFIKQTLLDAIEENGLQQQSMAQALNVSSPALIVRCRKNPEFRALIISVLQMFVDKRNIDIDVDAFFNHGTDIKLPDLKAAIAGKPKKNNYLKHVSTISFERMNDLVGTVSVSFLTPTPGNITSVFDALKSILCLSDKELVNLLFWGEARQDKRHRRVRFLKKWCAGELKMPKSRWIHALMLLKGQEEIKKTKKD